MRKFRRKPGKHRHLLTVLLIYISFFCHYRHFCSWEFYCAISIIPRTVSKLPLCLISLSLNRLLNKLVKQIFFSLVVNESHALFRARNRNVKTSSVVESISLTVRVIILRLYVRSFTIGTIVFEPGNFYSLR